ncbi:MAG: GTPase Era [Actinomycetota bacterium]
MGDAPEGYRSGFVSLVGRPNVGKSTLLNQILKNKVAITSERPQTTRTAIRGILTTPRAQLVFVDTPGLHKPRTALGERLNRVVHNTLGEVDAVVFLLDAVAGVGSGDEFLAGELRTLTIPVLVVLNKIDAAKPAELESSRVRALRMGAEWPTYGVSARTGQGVSDLVSEIVERLPTGPLYYPPDAVTDQADQQMLAELIREKVLRLTREEVPHSVAVVVDEIRTEGDDGIEVYATIYVERDSQKGIVIGKGGRMLKEIGTSARRDIETFLGGKHVYLHLRVKVEHDWQRRAAMVERFGYGT